jgi:hypothetical protein
LPGRNERQIIIDCLAVRAVALVETGATEREAHAELIIDLTRLGVVDVVAVVREAADAVTRLPQPADESVEEIERARPVRVLLGVPSAIQELEAALRGKEWLERLAENLETGRDA